MEEPKIRITYDQIRKEEKRIETERHYRLTSPEVREKNLREIYDIISNNREVFFSDGAEKLNLGDKELILYLDYDFEFYQRELNTAKWKLTPRMSRRTRTDEDLRVVGYYIEPLDEEPDEPEEPEPSLLDRIKAFLGLG